MHVSKLAAAAVLAAVVVVCGAVSLSGQSISQAGGQGRTPASETVEGTLEVLVEDYPTTARIRRFLHSQAERIELLDTRGRQPLRGLQTGARIRVRGVRASNRALDVEALDMTSPTDPVAALSLSRTFGEQRVAVILVNFSDNPAVPYNWSHASQVTFQTVNSYMLENSYGQTWLSGDVYGWFTIPLSGNVCDPQRLAAQADQAATAAGVNLGSYGRKLYAFPQNGCGWAGLGSVGGWPSRAWINGTFALKVVGHELGHNLGLHHSHSQPCSGGSCAIDDYGDDRDIMGNRASGHFNAYQKDRLGWLNYGGSPPIQFVSTSGTYRIESLQLAGGAPRALRIAKSGTTSYYVEARTQTGFDAPYQPGVVIHTGDSTDGNTSNQIDLDPQGGYDSVLDPGQSFADAVAGITITTVSSDGAGAWVAVTFGSAPCTSRVPTVTVSPSVSSVLAGGTATVSLDVANNDDPTCASSTFVPTVSAPSGWTASVGQPSLLIAGGGAQTTSLLITAPAWATGTSSFSVTLTRAGGSGAGGAATGTVSIVSAPPSGTCVRGLAITDSSGAVWTIGSQLQTLRNGAHAGGGFGSEYALVNGEVRVLGTDGQWWRWTGSGWTVGAAPTCGGTSTPPPGGTCVRGLTVTDPTGAVWTIGPQLQTMRNGVHAGGGLGSEYALVDGEVRVLGTDSQWWRWTGSTWTAGAAPTCSGTTAPPPGDTCLRGVSVTDSAGAIWTIGPALQTLRNGVHVAGGFGSEYAIVSSEVRVLGTDNQWWRWTGSVWTVGTAPSCSGTTAPPPGGACVRGVSVTDTTGAIWTIGSGHETLRDGVHAGSGYGSEYAVVDGELRVLGTDNQWWRWLGSGWAVGGAPSCALVWP